MANPDHISILRQGVAAWNNWRSKSKETPDLSNVELQRINLERLSRANAQGADLSSAKLNGANFANGNFRGADFTSANLFKTILSKTDLRETYFHNASLKGANLFGADIRGADFTKADLNGANLTEAKLQYTGLDFVNLSNVLGLESCKHYGPSDIGFNTLTESGNLPTAFLKGCGLSDRLIENLPSLTTDAIKFHYCFISYSHKDKEIADKIYEELQMRGIRCWKDDHSMLLGENILDAVNRGINITNKVILICSADSLESPWVKDEIDKAIEKENKTPKEQGKITLVLIPLIVDNYLLHWVDGRATKIRTRLCGDFCNWKVPSEFQKSLKILIKSLQANE